MGRTAEGAGRAVAEPLHWDRLRDEVESRREHRLTPFSELARTLIVLGAERPGHL
jgi:hypothetical protein